MTRTFVHRHTVTFEETNLVGNVYFTHYLRWQGHCREHFLASRAPGVVADLSDGLALVTVSCAVDYLGECRALDEIDIHMSLGQASGGRVDMRFDYYRDEPARPTRVARGQQTVACMRRSGGSLEPVAVPDELYAALRPYMGTTS